MKRLRPTAPSGPCSISASNASDLSVVDREKRGAGPRPTSDLGRPPLTEWKTRANLNGIVRARSKAGLVILNWAAWGLDHRPVHATQSLEEEGESSVRCTPLWHAAGSPSRTTFRSLDPALDIHWLSAPFSAGLVIFNWATWGLDHRPVHATQSLEEEGESSVRCTPLRHAAGSPSRTTFRGLDPALDIHWLSAPFSAGLVILNWAAWGLDHWPVHATQSLEEEGESSVCCTPFRRAAGSPSRTAFRGLDPARDIRWLAARPFRRLPEHFAYRSLQRHVIGLRQVALHSGQAGHALDFLASAG